MTNTEAIMGFVHLVVSADGEVKAKELELINKMLLVEKLSAKNAQDLLLPFKTIDKELVFANSIKGFKKSDKASQIKFIAWLCVIANADGFMDQEEWGVIYRIYHKELGLQTNEVMDKQKEINRDILNKSVSFGIKVND